MKRPAFQFYPADWLANAKLRRCSEAARGAWIDVLCLLHGADEYGILRWPLADIARAAGLPIRLLKELAEKDVLKGGDKGHPGYIYTPRHAGQDGEPVTLIIPTSTAIWFCSRFVRDEYVRQKRGAGTRFGSEMPSPKRTPKPPFGDGKGDGPSSSSPSSKENPLSLARDDRLDLPGLSGYHPEDWQPDLERLEALMTRAGVPMPEAFALANSLTRFNLHLAGKPMTDTETYGRLVGWLSEDYRREQSRQTRGPGSAGSQGFAKGDAVGAEWLAEQQRLEAGG